MKISELITRLEYLKMHNGDLDVRIGQDGWDVQANAGIIAAQPPSRTFAFSSNHFWFVEISGRKA